RLEWVWGRDAVSGRQHPGECRGVCCGRRYPYLEVFEGRPCRSDCAGYRDSIQRVDLSACELNGQVLWRTRSVSCPGDVLRLQNADGSVGVAWGAAVCDNYGPVRRVRRSLVQRQIVWHRQRDCIVEYTCGLDVKRAHRRGVPIAIVGLDDEPREP